MNLQMERMRTLIPCYHPVNIIITKVQHSFKSTPFSKQKHTSKKDYSLHGKSKQTLLERLPESLNAFFHSEDDTGTTENPDATKAPIHIP